MIELYCRERHGGRQECCAECADLMRYAFARVAKCPFGPDKPKCSACKVHCYQPAYRERIREVMRYAGPRMLRSHPVLALGHLLDGVLHPPKERPDRKTVRASS
jgi:hypothetical protein